MPSEPLPPLKPCPTCEELARRIALARPPLYHEQRTELATELMVHRATAAPACPNQASSLVPVATYDSPTAPCRDCVAIFITLHRQQGDVDRASTDEERRDARRTLEVTQRERTWHRTPERCPSVVAALSVQAGAA